MWRHLSQQPAVSVRDRSTESHWLAKQITWQSRDGLQPSWTHWSSADGASERPTSFHRINRWTRPLASVTSQKAAFLKPRTTTGRCKRRQETTPPNSKELGEEFQKSLIQEKKLDPQTNQSPEHTYSPQTLCQRGNKHTHTHEQNAFYKSLHYSCNSTICHEPCDWNIYHDIFVWHSPATKTGEEII